MKNFGQVLEKNKGFGPGFEFLRIWLAVSVLWFHSFVVIGHMDRLEATPAWFYIYSLMPCFFALSGFLIAGSAERLNLGNFLINRGLRIIPALAVEISISALILGPIFTTFLLKTYFSSSMFWHYFTNIVGWIQYNLPGVFTNLPSSGIVNQSLWTVPFEVGCYFFISIVIVLKLLKRPALIAILAALLLVLPAVFQVAGLIDDKNGTTYRALHYLLFSRGALLFPGFLLGVLVYKMRYRIPYSRMLGGGSLLICLAIAIFGKQAWTEQYALNIIAIPLLVYITVFLGCSRLPRISFYSRGDYSYGIYLYGYPFQQAIISVFPALTFWLWHFMASLAVVTVAAVFSWHVIEKPILAQRKKLSFAGKKIAFESQS